MKPTPCPDNHRRSWFRQSFGDLYSVVYAHRNDEEAEQEIRALTGWIRISPGDRVLDSCCGNGRHLKVILTQTATGFGFDLSPELIEQAAACPELERRICRADIRAIPFTECFDMVLNLFTSFGYFQRDDENRAAFHELCRCLAPGGLLVVDHIHAAGLRATLVPESEVFRRGMRIIQQRWIRGNRVQKRIEITNSIGDQTVFREDVRIYEPEEMTGFARDEGLSDISLSGGYDGSPFGSDSARMILTARRL